VSTATEGLRALRLLDGAALANAIETFDVRLRNEGFADASVMAMFSDLPPAVGYAATAKIRCSSPPPIGHHYHDRTDWWTYIQSVPAPRFVVVEDVDERAGLGSMVGEVHAQILRALGCAGYATNGSVRDIAAVHDEVRFPLFASGVVVSHAFAHIIEFGAPVRVGGLRVNSGDLLFGDVNGLQSVPPQLVELLPQVAAELARRDTQIARLCRSPEFSIEALRTLVRSFQ
jgi:4-hydroxy-4-methyl-2-oxoglutarate aldolase